MMLPKILIGLVIILVLIVVGLFLLKRLKKSEDEDDIEKLIADLTGEDDEETPIDTAQENDELIKDQEKITDAEVKIENTAHKEEPVSKLTQKDADEQAITDRFTIKDLRAASDENKKIEKAKRKARVIVREIQMYHKEKTEIGLKEGNLFKYLKDEIEAGRKAFEQEVPEDIRKKSNYYNESLLNILAKGDKKLLGME